MKHNEILREDWKPFHNWLTQTHECTNIKPTSEWEYIRLAIKVDGYDEIGIAYRNSRNSRLKLTGIIFHLYFEEYKTK